MDKYKTILAILLFILAFIIPVLILLGGGSVTILQMIQRSPGDTGTVDLPRNLLLTLGGALAAFIIFAALAIGVLFTIKDLTWLGASLPFLFSTVYSTALVDIIPDAAPLIGNIDDGTVVSFGALFSMLLTLHRNPRVSKWVFIPLVVAAAYTFFGGVFPGGIDEIIIQALSYLTFAYGTAKRLPPPEEETDVSIS